MIKGKNAGIIDCEYCFEFWSSEDFLKSINTPLQMLMIEELGWNLDGCGKASKGNYHITNNGQLHIDVGNCFPEALENWLDGVDSQIQHPELFNNLNKIII